MNTAQNPRIIRFGSFEADLHTRELRKHGLKLKVQEQPFQVLAMLLARPGELVTREEIRSRLWPQDTFIDFDHGLNAAVRRLRDALNDNAETPRFVETLPRRGYRFIAPVEKLGIEEAVQQKAGVVATSPDRNYGINGNRCKAVREGYSSQGYGSWARNGFHGSDRWLSNPSPP